MIGLLLIAAASADLAASCAYDVIVRAQVPPHCHPRRGDPLDAVKGLPKGWATLHVRRDGSVVVAQNGIHFEADTETWQRSGADMANYVFRAPTDGSPLCIGSRIESVEGSVQLRRILDPRDFPGSQIRFTAFAASREAKSVSFWLNGGGRREEFRTDRMGRHAWLDACQHRRPGF